MSIPSKILKIRDIFFSSRIDNFTILDVRSPSEYEEDHIPGSFNYPVLDDEERAAVGTIYKQISTFKAREEGARIISKNIASILPEISILSEIKKPFLVYCWRGGMRSRSLFTVMELIGYKSFLLEGGYRAYRKNVHEIIGEEAIDKEKSSFLTGEFLSIHGYTGSGKTDLLELLKNQYSIIDLEKAAMHRGSFLGSYKEYPQPSQKMFETDIFFQFINQSSTNYILEGESRKIGRLTIPPVIWNKMQKSRKVWVEMPLSFRIENSIKTYTNDIDHILEKLFLLEENLGKKLTQEIRKMIEMSDLPGAAEILLVKYYDPLYKKHSPEKNPNRYDEVIKADNMACLYEKIKLYLENISF